MESVSASLLEGSPSIDKSGAAQDFAQMLTKPVETADLYVIDEASLSSPDDNQFLRLSEQLEQIVDMASQEIKPPVGHELTPQSRASIEASNRVLQAQAEIVRLSLLMETASSTKQSVQTLFNMQQ